MRAKIVGEADEGCFSVGRLHFGHTLADLSLILCKVNSEHLKAFRLRVHLGEIRTIRRSLSVADSLNADDVTIHLPVIAFELSDEWDGDRDRSGRGAHHSGRSAWGRFCHNGLHLY